MFTVIDRCDASAAKFQDGNRNLQHSVAVVKQFPTVLDWSVSSLESAVCDVERIPPVRPRMKERRPSGRCLRTPRSTSQLEKRPAGARLYAKVAVADGSWRDERELHGPALDQNLEVGVLLTGRETPRRWMDTSTH
jgi:hypothetical protein